MPDPLPVRHGVRRGLDDAVTLVIPEVERGNHYAGGGATGREVQSYLDEIGGDRGFRAPMLSAVAAYFATNGAAADRDRIKALIRGAIDAAPAGGRGRDDIDRYRSDQHLDEMLEWCAVREAAKPPRRPRLVTITITRTV